MNQMANVFCLCLGTLAGYFIAIGMIACEISAKCKRKEKDMPTLYDDVNAVCPFFRYSDKRKISCEGITDGCTTTIEFDCKANRDLHRRVFCNSKYQNCEVHKMLSEKYADE